MRNIRTILSAFAIIGGAAAAMAAPTALSRVKVDGDNVWVGHDSGVFSYNKTTGAITDYATPAINGSSFASKSVSDVAITPTHGILVCTPDQGLLTIDGERLTAFPGTSASTPGLNVTAVAEGADGTLWVSGHHSGIYSLKADGWHLLESDPSIYSNYHHTAFCLDNDGTLWFTTNGGWYESLGYCDSQGYHTLDGESFEQLINRGFNSLAIAADGSKWMSSTYGGVYKCVGQELSKVEVDGVVTDPGTPTRDLKIADNGDIMFAIADKIVRFTEGHSPVITTVELNDVTDHITGFALDGEITWVISYNGQLIKLENGTATGINTSAGIEAAEADTTARQPSIHDLNGRSVKGRPSPGIYVVDGKTTLIR